MAGHTARGERPIKGLTAIIRNTLGKNSVKGDIRRTEEWEFPSESISKTVKSGKPSPKFSFEEGMFRLVLFR